MGFVVGCSNNNLCVSNSYICSARSAKRLDSLSIWVICFVGLGYIRARGVRENLATALSSEITLMKKKKKKPALTDGLLPPQQSAENRVEPQIRTALLLWGLSLFPLSRFPFCCVCVCLLIFNRDDNVRSFSQCHRRLASSAWFSHKVVFVVPARERVIASGADLVRCFTSTKDAEKDWTLWKRGGLAHRQFARVGGLRSSFFQYKRNTSPQTYFVISTFHSRFLKTIRAMPYNHGQR